MKLTSILGSALMFGLALVSTAQAKEVAFSGSQFRSLTNATQACLQYNDTGWMWYNQSAGTCASPMTVVASVPHVNDSALTGTQYCYVDGSCPANATATCTLKTINWSNGAVVGTPSSLTSTAGQTFDLSLTQNFSDIGSYNYEVISCSLQPGCRIWGAGCSF